MNFRVTLMKNLWPLPVFCALGIAALSTVQNVVTTCSVARNILTESR